MPADQHASQHADRSAPYAGLLDDYRRAAQQLLASVEDASEQQLDAPTEEGEDGVWTVRAHVHHAADVSAMGALRLRLMLADVALEYWRYDQAAFQQANRYERPIASSLALINAAAESNAAILERLPAAEWNTPRPLPNARTFTAANWLQNAAAHLQDHAQTITRTLHR